MNNSSLFLRSHLLGLTFLAMVCLLTTSVSAGRPLVAKDYFSIAAAIDVAYSPDNDTVAYVDLRWDDLTKKRFANIWLTSGSGKFAPRRLTFSSSWDLHPTFAPDGKRLYFSSSRSGKKQVYVVDLDGDRLRQVTKYKDGIKSFRLSRSGKSLYVERTKKTTNAPWKALKSRYSDLTYGHGVWTFSRIESIDLTTWRRQRLIDDDRVLVAWDVAPDESKIAMITRPTNELITNEGWSTVDIWSRDTGEITRIKDTLWRAEAPSPYGWLDAPSWSPDGSALSFTVDFDGYPTELLITRFSAKSEPQTHRVIRPRQLKMNGGAATQWIGKSLVFAGEEKARVRLYRLHNAHDPQSEAESLTDGDVVVGAFALNKGGDRVAFAMSSKTSFGDVFTAPVAVGNKRFRRVSELNPQAAEWNLPSVEVVTWKSSDGVEVEGILELPHGVKDPKGLPMIVNIHGGPASSSKLRRRFWGYGRTIMASLGYAVFSPNYRGSTGFGDKFLVDLIGRKNDIDVADIMTGVDAMIARGIADPKRLGVMGWSNGGYLTNCLVAHPVHGKRFKAASSGAGVFDTAMQWMIEDTPGHVVNYSKGLPWKRVERMRKSSPLYTIDSATTPTLIHVGENDPRVPKEHSIALHRALHTYLKVPTELIIYPKTGHSLRSWTHKLAKMEWDIDWFEQYLPVKQARRGAASK
jgi:dipeptidyl aminopeptidase/acylaminoacyl peptidase